MRENNCVYLSVLEDNFGHLINEREKKAHFLFNLCEWGTKTLLDLHYMATVAVQRCPIHSLKITLMSSIHDTNISV